MLLFLLIPCHNEAGNIPLLVHRVAEVLRNTEYEIIFIDDGSRYYTPTVTRKKRRKNVK